MEDHFWFERTRRRNVVRTVVAIVSVVIGGALFAIGTTRWPFPPTGTPPRDQISILLAGGSMVILGLLQLILLYLGGTAELPRFFSGLASVLFRAGGFLSDINIAPSGVGEHQELHELKRKVDQLQRAQISSSTGEGSEKLTAALLPLLQDSMSEVLSRKFAEQSVENERVQAVRGTYSAAQDRLRSELEALRKRANLSLGIGTVITIMAIGLLYYLLLGSARTFENLLALLSFYIPRVSLVVFIEVFAFFFLRLYRATLQEIRSYQVDVTKLNIQNIASEMAWTDQSVAARRGFAETLLTTQFQPAHVPKEEPSLKELEDVVAQLVKALPQKAAAKE